MRQLYTRASGLGTNWVMGKFLQQLETPSNYFCPLTSGWRKLLRP